MNHNEYIQRCLQLAQNGKGHVSPNPMVGAVLVHQGRIIGEGWHQQYGQAHAEVNCLNAVAEADKALIPESTMYASLEPCAHHGNTPPCANRIVAEGIKHVVICNTDPHDKVAGKGIQILKDAGIEVTTGILSEAGLWLNRRFFCYHQQQRPYIILKWAQTADGFIAPLNRSRYAITNSSSNQLVHKWRTEENAILVGYQTALNDNPELTARHWQGQNPLRIVLDKNLQLDNSSKLFNHEAATWVLNNSKEGTADNIQYVQLDFSQDILPQLLQKLYTARKQSLIVEGGAVLLQKFIDAGLWDEARILTADKSLAEGIHAPQLNSSPVFSTCIDNDTIDLHTHPNTHYPFVKGWDL